MGSTSISAPAAPAAPTPAETAAQYAASLPIYWENQLKYAPLEAAQQVSLAQQYSLPLAQAYKQANDIMYPGTSGLQESLAAQAQTGMTSGLTDAEKQQYQSDLASQLGTNVGSGIGSDYMSRNMLMQQQNRQDYFRNLALSAAGRQPLTTAQPVNSLNYMQNYTPTANANFVGQGYGNYSGAYSNMYGTNAQVGMANTQAKNQLIGQTIGSLGTMAMMSSRDVKDNITEKNIKALDLIDELTPVEFNYKGEEEKIYGFISEDSPDIITAKDKKSVNLYSCIGVLTKAIKELKEEVESLKEK